MSLLIDTVSRLGRVFGRSNSAMAEDRVNRRFDALHLSTPHAPPKRRLFRG